MQTLWQKNTRHVGGQRVANDVTGLTKERRKLMRRTRDNNEAARLCKRSLLLNCLTLLALAPELPVKVEGLRLTDCLLRQLFEVKVS